MKTELLAWLINATIATSLSCVAIAILRRPLQRVLGAEIAYRLWIALPLAAIAACLSLPHRAQVSHQAAQAVAASATPTFVVEVTRALAGIAADRWLLAVWMAGVVVLASVFAWQQRHYVARLRLRRAADGSWRSGTSGATPAVLGLLRQKLVLPERFEMVYSDEERHLVLAHERMHQRRRDPWALATCALLRTVFWFNPLVHLSASLFRRDVELACDAAVLRSHPCSRRRYADALFKAELADGALPIGCQWHPTPPMKERIMLLTQAVPSRRARWLGMVVVAVAASGATCVALAAHDAATGAASALATTGTAPSTYLVRLDMSVDGKPVAQPSLYVRSGDEAVVRIDDKGRPWGLRFHVRPERGASHAMVRMGGDVFTNDEQHVIGHPDLGLAAGRAGVIELNDPRATTTRPVYRIAATVTPSAIPAPPEVPAPPTAPPTPPAAAMAVAPLPPSMAAPLPPTPPPTPMAAGVGTEGRPIVPAPPAPPAPALAPRPPSPPPPSARNHRVSISVRGPSGTAAPVAPAPPETPEPDAVAPAAPIAH